MIKNGLTKRFIEVGKIKIGGKGETRTKQGGGTYQLPVRFEHFVVTTTEKGKDGNFLVDKEIMSKLGNEPKEIPIRLPFDEIDMNFFTSFQHYQGNKCLCRGDGEKATRTDAQGNEKQINCNPDVCEYLKPDDKGATKCKPSGILSCQIPLGKMEIGGIYRFRTHSWNSVSSILAALEYFSDNTNGVLQGLPLKLKFLKKATQEHGNVNVVTIVMDGVELIKMRELAYVEYENRMKLGINMKQIENQAREAGFLNDTDDPADVQDEFYTVVSDDKPITGTTADHAAEKLKEKDKPVEKSEAKGGDLL